MQFFLSTKIYYKLFTGKEHFKKLSIYYKNEDWYTIWSREKIIGSCSSASIRLCIWDVGPKLNKNVNS